MNQPNIALHGSHSRFWRGLSPATQARLRVLLIS